MGSVVGGDELGELRPHFRVYHYGALVCGVEVIYVGFLVSVVVFDGDVMYDCSVGGVEVGGGGDFSGCSNKPCTFLVSEFF